MSLERKVSEGKRKSCRSSATLKRTEAITSITLTHLRYKVL